MSNAILAPVHGKRFRLEASLWRFLLSMLVLMFAGGLGLAQQNPVSYWDLPQKTVETMLTQVPDTNELRFERLRQYFTELHCTSDLMEVQTINKHNEKNLICVLPGKSADQVVVAARYDLQGKIDGVKQGWSEAVALPILYNALRSQKREHTFIFVALCGYDGQKAFLESIRQVKRPAPKFAIALDAFSLSSPWFMRSALPDTPKSQKDLYDIVQADAVYTLRLQHMFQQEVRLMPSDSVREMQKLWAERVPTILVTSGYEIELDAESHINWQNPLAAQHVTPTAFKQDLEFTAYFLCKLDATLAAPAAANQEQQQSSK